MSHVDDSATAFSALVREHLPMIRRYAARRVPAADIDDLVGEVFAAAWQHRERVPNPATYWLLRTAWFHLQHHYRRQRRDERLAVRLAAQPVEDSADPASRTVETVRIRLALAKLPDRDQEVLRLSAWEGLDTASIATVLICSQSAVRVRLHRARRRLARLLRESDSPKVGVPPTLRAERRSIP